MHKKQTNTMDIHGKYILNVHIIARISLSLPIQARILISRKKEKSHCVTSVSILFTFRKKIFSAMKTTVSFQVIRKILKTDAENWKAYIFVRKEKGTLKFRKKDQYILIYHRLTNLIRTWNETSQRLFLEGQKGLGQWPMDSELKM